MANPFMGKLFAITGGASGIGLATARKLASRGALLSLADLNTTALNTAAEELESLHTKARKATAITNQAIPTITDTPAVDVPQFSSAPTKAPIFTTTLDVTHPPSVSEWIHNTISHFQVPLSGCANMAGIIGPSIGKVFGTVRILSTSEFQRIMSVHVEGTFNCMQAQLPALTQGEEGSGLGGGSIVNASSIAGRMGFERNAGYTAAKHAIAGMTKAVAKEEGRRGIRVNAVAPGYVDTPMTQSLAADAEEFAGVEGTSAQAISGGTGGQDSAQDSEHMEKQDQRVSDVKYPGAMGRKGMPEEVANLIVWLLSDESSFCTGHLYAVDGGWGC